MGTRIDTTLAADLLPEAAQSAADVMDPDCLTDAAERLQRPTDFFSTDQLDQFRSVSDLRGLGLVLHCWAVILGVWVVVSMWTNPLTVVLGIVVVGARQLGLAVLSHDGAHFGLLRNRAANDWVSEWLLSRPLLGASIESYRRYHLKHHANTQQPDDPDLHLSKPFPISLASFQRKVWRDLTGQTGFKQYGGMIQGYFANGFWRGMRRLGPNIGINAMFLAGFAVWSEWWLFFLLWWVPALTWNRFVTRLRNIGEHAAVPDDNDRLRNTRTIKASWLERALVAPYFVNFHLEHHLVVNAPCYRLPSIHDVLLKQGLASHMELKASYPEMLREAALCA
ncbi:MAG: fatty acid desaturase family protein [Pseudomonadota bacterium]